MAVFHRQDSLKELHAEQEQKKTQKDEIGEIQDALIEIAEIVSTMAVPASEKEGGNG